MAKPFNGKAYRSHKKRPPANRIWKSGKNIRSFAATIQIMLQQRNYFFFYFFGPYRDTE